MYVSPYLAFNGQCAEAFRFYEATFGGKHLILIPHRGTPAEEEVPPEWRDKIIHARLEIGATLLMGGDAPPQHYREPAGFSVSYQADDVSQAERVFAALSEGATVRMPMQKTFWAQRFGMLIDRFKTPWMVNCD